MLKQYFLSRFRFLDFYQGKCNQYFRSNETLSEKKISGLEFY